MIKIKKININFIIYKINNIKKGLNINLKIH